MSELSESDKKTLYGRLPCNAELDFDALEELFVSVDKIISEREQLAVAGMREAAAQRMTEHHLTSCNPYTGYYVVRCRCGWSTRTELNESDAIKLWADHAIRALPDAAADAVLDKLVNERVKARDMVMAAAAEEATFERLRPFLEHGEKCLWNTPLATGQGTWSCDCGLDNVSEPFEVGALAAHDRDIRLEEAKNALTLIHCHGDMAEGQIRNRINELRALPASPDEGDAGRR